MKRKRYRLVFYSPILCSVWVFPSKDTGTLSQRRAMKFLWDYLTRFPEDQATILEVEQ